MTQPGLLVGIFVHNEITLLADVLRKPLNFNLFIDTPYQAVMSIVAVAVAGITLLAWAPMRAAGHAANV